MFTWFSHFSLSLAECYHDSYICGGFFEARNLQSLFIVIVWKRALKAVVEFSLFLFNWKKNSHTARNDMMMNTWTKLLIKKNLSRILNLHNVKKHLGLNVRYLLLINPIRFKLLHLTIWILLYYIILYYIVTIFYHYLIVFTMNIFILIPSNLNKCI